MKPERAAWLKSCEDLEPGLADDDKVWAVFEDGYRHGFEKLGTPCPHFFTIDLEEAEDRKAARAENMFCRIWTAAWNNGSHDRAQRDVEEVAKTRRCPLRKTTTAYTNDAGITETDQEFMLCMGRSCMAFNQGDPIAVEDVCLAFTPRRVTYEQNP